MANKELKQPILENLEDEQLNAVTGGQGLANPDSPIDILCITLENESKAKDKDRFDAILKEKAANRESNTCL